MANDQAHSNRMAAIGGLLLLAAVILAMLVKNTGFASAYDAFLKIDGIVKIGGLGVEKPLFLWVNDGLMAVFFFMIGLEIKREWLHGELKDKKQVVLPMAGAIGGVVFPALIYLWFNADDPEAIVGWAIPTATDIAFALGVLTMLGSRVPTSLKVFLMTLAILDDLIAIIIIALFYTANLSLQSLLFAAGFIVFMLLCNRLGVKNLGIYILLGVATWVCVLKSGVHATLAGVITALLIPSHSDKHSANQDSPSDVALHAIHPWVILGIVPLFAFVNGGISFTDLNLGRIIEPIPLGIALGLFIGKPVGVMLCSWLVVSLKLASPLPGVTWSQMLGVAFICGIGFTMSLFIGGLAFAEVGIGYNRIDRLGMLIGSLSSAIVGVIILYLAAGQNNKPDTAD
ncbi:MAG: Na+/H+ antiporter NhaA [Aestuariibacter sp.]